MNITSIEWTGYTWNPVTGCTPVSEGCRNCYAKRMAHRLRGRFGYPADEPFRVTLHPERLEEPLRLTKPSRIFVASMGDLFHEGVPMEFIAEVFDVMASATVNCGKRHRHSEECWGGSPHTFLILTKRPQSMKQALEDLPNWVEEYWSDDAPLSLCLEVGLWPLYNVWLGVSVENQAAADERIPILLQTPAAVRWVSVEPMLGPIRFAPGWLDGQCDALCEDYPECRCVNGDPWPHLDWVVCGGETGPGARPVHPDWVRSLRDQCHSAKVAFYFKSWGEWLPPYATLSPGEGYKEEWIAGIKRHPRADADPSGLDPAPVWRVGRKRAGRLLDGRTWDEFPGGGGSI